MSTTLISGGTVVTASGTLDADVLVAGEKIAAVFARDVTPTGEAAGGDGDEVIVRDLDMDKLTEVRDLWQFYRDRRPDAYESLVAP